LLVGSGFDGWEVVEAGKYEPAGLAGEGGYFLGALRWAADAQAAIAAFEQAAGDGVKDLVKYLVAYALGAGMLDEMQGKLLPNHRQVAGAEDAQGRGGYLADVGGDTLGVVVGARAIGTGDEDEERMGGLRVPGTTGGRVWPDALTGSGGSGVNKALDQAQYFAG
jgi:hypothetical protein